jgi:hypothetical protein
VTEDETYSTMTLEELMIAMDSVIADKSMTEEMKSEKLRVIVSLVAHYRLPLPAPSTGIRSGTRNQR